MKKISVFLVSVLLIISLSACGLARKPYTVQGGVHTYVIDPVAETMSDGTSTYKYGITFSGGGAYVFLRRTSNNPFRSSWYHVYPDGTVVGATSSKQEKAQARELAGALKNEIERKTPKPLDLVPIILADIGLITLIVPQIVWYMTIGLFRRNKEPSGNALIAYRAGGAGALVVGIVFIFVAML